LAKSLDRLLYEKYYMLITTRQESIVKGYQSPSEHARQVALVKESLKRTKHGGARMPPIRPTADMRAFAAGIHR
jgi:hypothetical protein